VKVGLDPSVVLRLAARQPRTRRTGSGFSGRTCRAGGHHAVVSDLVVAEVYFALQHHYDVLKQDVLLGLRRLFADGEIEPLGAVAEVLATDGLASAKPGFCGPANSWSLRDAADEMVTFEKATGKLKSVRVL